VARTARARVLALTNLWSMWAGLPVVVGRVFPLDTRRNRVGSAKLPPFTLRP